jgi:hypothetical protein
MLMEGGKRILSKSIEKKEPITTEILEKILNKYGQDESEHNLSSVRIFTFVLLGFAGFLRFNELANLRVKDISFHDLYISVTIEKSKTDVYRRGNNVLIASTGNKTCPVFWLKSIYNWQAFQISQMISFFALFVISNQLCDKRVAYRSFEFSWFER